MRSKGTFFFLAFTLHLAWVSGQTDYAALVNPFIGTGGHGHTYPGASMPFGMMQLSPDTRLEGWDGCGVIIIPIRSCTVFRIPTSAERALPTTAISW